MCYERLRRAAALAAPFQSADGAYGSERAIVIPRPTPARARRRALWPSPFRTPGLIRDPVIIDASVGAAVA